jgi:membrane-bound serine protease (ClpP class)
MTTKYFLMSVCLILLAQPTFAVSLHTDLQNSTSFILILLGIIFTLAEFGASSAGVLGAIGLMLLIAGVLFLEPALLQQAWPLILAIFILHVLFLGLVVVMAIKARQRKKVIGTETLIGKTAVVVADFSNHEGWVRHEGELWQAQAEQSLHAGQKVQIIKIDGLTLFVNAL